MGLKLPAALAAAMAILGVDTGWPKPLPDRLVLGAFAAMVSP